MRRGTGSSGLDFPLEFHWDFGRRLALPTRTMTNPRSTILGLITASTIGGAASAAPPPASVTIVKSTLSAFGGGVLDDPNQPEVPNIPFEQPVTWRYEVTNTGTTSVPFANVVVTDDQPNVFPGFIGVLVGDADNLLEPGESWRYEASGIRFCAVFGGAISQNDGRRYHARFAPSPDDCPILGGF